MELLVGCGSLRDKRVPVLGPTWTELVTLDINPAHNPDVVADLTQYPYPFEDNTFEEVHAYEVLEHMGTQGDYLSFFKQFEEFWRILKPDGLFCATVPWWQGRWAWADPGHTRIITPDSLTFLQQVAYEDEQAMMTDYRFCYKADFVPVFGQKFAYEKFDPDEAAEFGTPEHFAFAIKAVK